MKFPGLVTVGMVMLAGGLAGGLMGCAADEAPGDTEEGTSPESVPEGTEGEATTDETTPAEEAVLPEPVLPAEAVPTTALVQGCEGQQLREGIPEDLAAPGPWPVGAVTTMLGGVPTEIWYPARQDSVEGASQVVYDIREHLPMEERDRIPDANNPSQPCNCYRDLPLDTEAGPYPVVQFIHGTAAFRTSNLENAVHWASRGFVVVASDHPGIRLCDTLAIFTASTACGEGPNDQGADARRVLEDLASGAGEAAFLDGHIDMDRVGIMGHSAGAGAATGLGDVADVLIPYAGAGLGITGDRVQSSLFVVGDMDGVAAPSTAGYDGAVQPNRRNAFIARGGHLVGGSLCDLRDPMDKSKDIVDLAGEHELGGAGFGLILPTAFGFLFDGCNELPEDDAPFLNGRRGIEILNFLTAGVLEDALQCSPTAAEQLREAQDTYGEDVSDYQETLP